MPRKEVVLTTLSHTDILKSLGEKDVRPSANKISYMVKQERREIKIAITEKNIILKKFNGSFLFNYKYIRESFF